MSFLNRGARPKAMVPTGPKELQTCIRSDTFIFKTTILELDLHGKCTMEDGLGMGKNGRV